MIFVETMFCGCNEGGAGYRCSYRILYGINLANVPNALSCTQALHDSATGIFPGIHWLPILQEHRQCDSRSISGFLQILVIKRPFCHPITIGIDRKCTNLVFLHRNVPIFACSECQGWRWDSHSHSKVNKVFFWRKHAVSERFQQFDHRNFHQISTWSLQKFDIFTFLHVNDAMGQRSSHLRSRKLLSIRCKVWQCVFLWFSKIS